MKIVIYLGTALLSTLLFGCGNNNPETMSVALGLEQSRAVARGSVKLNSLNATYLEQSDVEELNSIIKRDEMAYSALFNLFEDGEVHSIGVENLDAKIREYEKEIKNINTKTERLWEKYKDHLSSESTEKLTVLEEKKI
ncbi:hypothetical protein [Vibrio mediterranei]|uniref:hypothetical protein n=1 Tax=Vibrio mediterranei TaxID=689 RepID=UPI00148E0196|nr:hypothetical protein [Vibrio mediterranei]NOI26187.1 hypothetical protein [Vibrio mediterranei]